MQIYFYLSQNTGLFEEEGDAATDIYGRGGRAVWGWHTINCFYYLHLHRNEAVNTQHTQF